MTAGLRYRCTANSDLASKTKVSKLQRVLLQGIAYHHAGLELDDRQLVEANFRNGKIKILTCTSTLAHGVNLPARLVIVKGTKAWRGGGQRISGPGLSDITSNDWTRWSTWL